MRGVFALILCLLYASTDVVAQLEVQVDSVFLLPKSINSRFDESAPVFNPLQDRLYFTRTLHPGNKGGAGAGQDVWFSQLEGGEWSKPTNDLDGVNNLLNNSTTALGKKGERMYFVGSYDQKMDLQKGFSYSDHDSTGWHRPVKMKVKKLHIIGDFYGGYVNDEGNVLIISMNSKGSKGEEDLFVSFKDGDHWTKPLWMGDSINSSGYEISPSLSKDGKSLLFASNGFGGYGDCDIFVSHRLDSTWTKWSKPQNLGEPINSSSFDAFPFNDGEMFFFSSNRGDTFSNIYTGINLKGVQMADTMRLVFQSYNSRFSGVSVKVFDQRSEEVGDYQAGVDNVVRIGELRAGEDYHMVASHSMIDASVLNPMMINAEGDYIDEMEMDADGGFDATALSPEETEAAEQVEAPWYETGLGGVFEVDGVPIPDQFLALQDADGNVYQYVATDENGAFEFAETDDSLELFIEVLSDIEHIKNEGRVFYTDDEGNKLMRVEAGEQGNFTYNKLEAQELARLKDIQAAETSLNEEASGVFKFNNLPREGVKLILYDENNNPIEEVVTDENGQFVFSKLRPDQSFSIRVAEEDMEDGDLSFFGEGGSELDIMQAGGAGEFVFKPLTPDKKERLSRLDDFDDTSLQFDNPYVYSTGLFKYDNELYAGASLFLIDPLGDTIENAFTDENGQFVFSELTPNNEYKIFPAGVEEAGRSQLYFVSRDGAVTTGQLVDESYYKINGLNDAYMFTTEQLVDQEISSTVEESFEDVRGTFTFKGLPKEGVQLELLDENGKLLETAYTDENGNFKFNLLAQESSFMVRLAESDASFLEGSDIMFLGENQEKLEHQNGAGGFVFKTLSRTASSLAMLDSEDDSMLDMSKFSSESTPAEPEKTPAPVEPLEGKVCTIQFLFNSVRLSDRDRARLNEQVIDQLESSQREIVIRGYSCDIGTEDQKNAVSLARANVLKEYLINMGVDSERIKVEAVGSAGMKDQSAESRYTNRKAEVYF